MTLFYLKIAYREPATPNSLKARSFSSLLYFMREASLPRVYCRGSLSFLGGKD